MTRDPPNSAQSILPTTFVKISLSEILFATVLKLCQKCESIKYVIVNRPRSSYETYCYNSLEKKI